MICTYIYISIYLSVCLSVYLSTCLSIYACMYACTQKSIHPSIQALGLFWWLLLEAGAAVSLFSVPTPSSGKKQGQKWRVKACEKP